MMLGQFRSLCRAPVKTVQGDGEHISQLVVDILSHGLGIPLHTLFQVSTSGALVHGVYERPVSSDAQLRSN
jgi:hypothetical protein